MSEAPPETRTPVVLLSEAEIAARVAALAERIAPRIDDDTVAVCLFTGGIWFAADLTRALARIGREAVRRMPPRWPGKATTALQFVFLLWVVYHREVPMSLLLLTGTVSVVAGIDYLRNPHWKRPEVAAPRAVVDDASADL